MNLVPAPVLLPPGPVWKQSPHGEWSRTERGWETQPRRQCSTLRIKLPLKLVLLHEAINTPFFFYQLELEFPFLPLASKRLTWWNRRTVCSFGHGSKRYFCGLTPTARDIKPKINKWELHQTKSFCTVPDRCSPVF